MTATITPYRSSLPTGRDGFAEALRAEWTRFRTVRGWTIAAAVAALLILALGTLSASGSHSEGLPPVPTGPGGEVVTDEFNMAGQTLPGDGTITAHITSFTGAEGFDQSRAGSQQTGGAPSPWAKAGLIIKQNTQPGSAYAAVMITGAHGVRLQHDYTGDVAGPAGSSWLRLTRSGNAVTAYASADGTTWAEVGAVHVASLAGAVQVGMFVTSPARLASEEHLGGGKDTGSGTVATAVFDDVSLTGAGNAAAWTGTSVGAGRDQPPPQFQQSGGAYTVSGSGDIAPGNHAATAFEQVLAAGTVAALAVVGVLGVLFMSTEYRRGLIRTSLTIGPRRGRLLAARALVLGAVAFVAGLIGAALTVPIGEHILRTNGNILAPVPTLTTVRIILGAAATIAVAAVLGLALGTILRRGAAAVATAIVVIVLPYLLATAGVLPSDPSRWLMRVTPAAAFAVEQSLPAYRQIDMVYDPMHGYYPLAPWAGFAVLCAWTAIALAAATLLLRRRDA